ncbi:hypothetical protein GCM10023350_03990 [Nocardioides endophyticus]|uniref:WXG100 family type VII secretion target n=1 Tax=Nocardioides endophyticus TaxID=1353775 RepID=A0ABP8YB22_9ACTN
MFTDTSGIRHLARRMRERAEEIRAEGAALRRRADDVPWQGRSAEAMRTHLAVRLTTLAATADLHDEAADALERHAGAVDSLTAVGGAVAGAADKLRSLL